MTRSIKLSIDHEGWLFVLIFAAISFMFSLLSDALGWIGLVLTVWCAYFFRDPDRTIPVGDHLIVSPADGVIDTVQQVTPPAEWDIGSEPRWRVSVFLNVFDVHVNRVPWGGKILKLIYHPGKFLNATLDKASDENERQVVTVETPQGDQIAFVQIAGLIARRIRCDVQEGHEVSTGQRFGMIRFGSRMDVYFPPKVVPLAVPGQRVIAGETIIADTQHQATEPRTGLLR